MRSLTAKFKFDIKEYASLLLILYFHSITFTIYSQKPYILVLGTTQDGGYPQAGCLKECCTLVHQGKEKPKNVSCIAIVDPENKKSWMIDATPDFALQYGKLIKSTGYDLNGILLTHAHIGHYTGLIHLGHEVMASQKLPVYTMPRMRSFIENNGPWSQLVKLNNIDLMDLYDDQTKTLSDQISILPLQVPHRDEFSETVGFIIKSRSKKILFIPDIDKWDKWNRSIVDLIKSVDLALLDGTFYQNGEIKGRDMTDIPHPFIVESMGLFESLSMQEKNKIKFIHFNHTNPVLRNTKERKLILRKGFGVAKEGERIGL